VILAAVGWMYVRMPSSFLPEEDQGSLIALVQLPAGATTHRTEDVMKQVENFFLKQEEVKSVVGVVGFSFSGIGQNAGLAFVTLKDHSERSGADHTAQALAKRAFGALMGVRDAFIYPLVPPPIMELGNATGFAVRLQDRAGLGHEALLAARNQMLGMAMQSKIVTRPAP
jgi:multidrug efflux pump